MDRTLKVFCTESQYDMAPLSAVIQVSRGFIKQKKRERERKEGDEARGEEGGGRVALAGEKSPDGSCMSN